MINQKTILTVSDNSGARLVECIKVSPRNAKSVTVVVKKVVNKSKVKKGDVLHGIVVRSRRLDPNVNGFRTRFEDNSVILSKKNGEPLGTRIFGPVDKSLRSAGFMKVISLASRTL